MWCREKGGGIESSVLRQLHLEGKVIWYMWSGHCDAVIKSFCHFPALVSFPFLIQNPVLQTRNSVLQAFEKGRGEWQENGLKSPVSIIVPFPLPFTKQILFGQD